VAPNAAVANRSVIAGKIRLCLRVLLGVELTGVFGMLGRMEVMTVREMRMMRRLLVGLLAMVMRGVAMVLGGCLVVFRGLFVMVGQFCCVHCASPVWWAVCPNRI